MEMPFCFNLRHLCPYPARLLNYVHFQAIYEELRENGKQSKRDRDLVGNACRKLTIHANELAKKVLPLVGATGIPD